MSVSQIFLNALDLATIAHSGQKRKTGEEYITHPIAVAEIAGTYGADIETRCACLLHDVVEDTPIRLNEIKDKFGKTISYLVDGVTKEKGRKTIRKVEEYAKKDKRVLFIKLCDRIHNVSNPVNKEWLKEKYYDSTKAYIDLGRKFGFNDLSDKLTEVFEEGVK